MNPKRGGLFWLIVIVCVLGGSLAMWIHFKAEGQDPRRKQYTKEQLLQMLTRREHQPIAIWEGLPMGSLEKSRAGMSGPNLRFGDAQTPLLMYQLDDVLEQDPLMFLALFDSKDPGPVMTGIFVYRQYLPDSLTREDEAKIATAFRKLLAYRDTRMRWAAIQTLGENRWLNVEDVEDGLNDKTADVRFTTAFWVHTLVEKEPRYTEDGKLVELDPNEVERLLETKHKLAPVLVEHLNDTHFYVRHIMGSGFRNIFKRPVKTERGTRYDEAPTLPEKFDWMRESWQQRENRKERWQKWWAEHGEEALQWAHPPQ